MENRSLSNEIDSYVCEIDKCTGCMACLNVCTKDALDFHDDGKSCNVYINIDKCINCGQCKKTCQVNYPNELHKPILWKQGWADNNIRELSSSGGFATQLMKSFIDINSYVCSCCFRSGEIKYYLTNKVDDIDIFKGSKYVKSNPGDIYKRIKAKLCEGNRVLFIGLPCHVAGLKKIVGKLDNKLYTVDLICHGTPSFQLLKCYLSEKGIDISKINSLDFRKKNSFGVFIDKKPLYPIGAIDNYTLAFLRGLFYTENCYECKYAQLSRVSDITIGDSWGTELKEEESKGISIALCQTEKGKDLLLSSNLYLYDVDIEKAIKANHQLSRPSSKPDNREKFFALFSKTGKVSKSIFKCYYYDCIRQKIKKRLLVLNSLYSQ